MIKGGGVGRTVGKFIGGLVTMIKGGVAEGGVSEEGEGSFGVGNGVGSVGAEGVTTDGGVLGRATVGAGVGPTVGGQPVPRYTSCRPAEKRPLGLYTFSPPKYNVTSP